MLSNSPTRRNSQRCESSRKELSSLHFGNYIQAYNQSQQRLQLGRESLLIVPAFGSDERVQLVIKPETRQIFDGNKLKFVVSIETNDTIDSSCVSIYEKPLCYDDNQCNYYLLKCTLRQNSQARNRILIGLMYVLAECCCLQAGDPRLMNVFLSTLHTVLPSWNKFNSLLLQASQEQHGYFTESTTAYETNSFPRDQHTEDLEEFEPFKPMKQTQPIQQQSTRNTNSHPQSTASKFCSNYFSKVIKIVEPFGSLFKAASHCKQYLMRGFSYNQEMLKEVIDLINHEQRIDMPKIQERLIKGNMFKSVEMCKKSYTELVKMLFLEGRSLELHRLGAVLGEVYEQVINSYDHEFQGLHHFQEFQIYRSILKRYIEQKESQVHELNDFMHQNQCLDGLQGSIDRKALCHFFNKKIQGAPDTNPSLSLAALKTFLLEFYTQSMQEDIERMKQRNQKLVMHTLNYSQNPIEILKNFEERVEYCRQKKRRLQDCLQLAEREYDTCDNLFHGFELELAEQRRALARLHERGGLITETVVSP